MSVQIKKIIQIFDKIDYIDEKLLGIVSQCFECRKNFPRIIVHLDENKIRELFFREKLTLLNDFTAAI